MSKCFEVQIDDGIGTIRLNRPDAYNAMIAEFWTELPALMTELDASGEVRAVILASTGKHFCAGMDLAVFTNPNSGLMGDTSVSETGRQRANLFETVLRLQDSFNVFERVRMPVLSAIQGGCIGGAVDMICATDMRYATADAFFCVQEINIGMTADVGTLQRLPKLIPDGVAREWAYTGDRVSAQRAKEVGLVNEIFEDHDQLIEGVTAIAKRIAAKSPLAIWGTKEQVLYARDHSVADSLRHMAGWQSGMFQPADMMEEFGAKAEGRDASFDPLPKRG